MTTTAKRGGKIEGAGRKKGSTNKKSKAAYKMAVSKGKLPLEIMLDLMHRFYRKGEAATKSLKHSEASEYFATAADRARDAAPFVHAKLQSVTQTNTYDWSTMNDEQLDKFIEFKRAMEQPSAKRSSG